MAVAPRNQSVYGFGRIPFGVQPSIRGLAGIVTPGTSTYPSDDGSFTIIRGTGSHYGNGLIDGYIIAGGEPGGVYDLDDNTTGSILAPNAAPKYKVGGELQRFIDATGNSPEYVAFLQQQRADQEVANPKLKAYDDALRRWAQSQQPPVSVDPVYGLATNFDFADAPQDVRDTYADFTGNPLPPPKAPPAPPARYLIAGITFDVNGVVYDSTGNPTGQTLTADQVHSLLTTGALPSGSTAPAPPSPSPQVPSTAPPTSNPTSQPAQPVATPVAPPTTVTRTPSTVAPDQTPTSVQPVTIAPMTNGTPPLQPPDSGTTTPTPAPLFGGLSDIPWWGWLAVGGALYVGTRNTRRR